MRRIIVLTVIVLLAMAGVQAQIISTGPGETEETRGGGSAILTVVEVGATPVPISSFGTFGSIVTPGNIKWVIFEGIEQNTTLVYQSAVTAATPGANAWLDAPVFDFTLLANTSYQIGLISDQSFNYTWTAPSTPITANGLTLAADDNGNGADFDNPITEGNGGVQQSFRAFGPTAAAAPEPGSLALLALGLSGAGLYLRRRARQS